MKYARTPAHSIRPDPLRTVITKSLANPLQVSNSLLRLSRAIEELLQLILFFVCLRRELLNGKGLVRLEEVWHVDSGVH